MWGRWSSTLGLRVYSTHAYALSSLILKEKRGKVLQISSNQAVEIHINKKTIYFEGKKNNQTVMNIFASVKAEKVN